MLSGIRDRASPRLFCLSEGDFRGHTPALMSQTGRFEDVALARLGAKRESKLVGPDEISPVAIVLRRVSKVEPVGFGLIRVGHFVVRPYSDPFSVRPGGALSVVIQLEAEFGGEFYLRAGRVEQADEYVKLWFAGDIVFESCQGHDVYLVGGIVNAEGLVRVIRRRHWLARKCRLATRLEKDQQDEQGMQYCGGCFHVRDQPTGIINRRQACGRVDVSLFADSQRCACSGGP